MSDRYFVHGDPHLDVSPDRLNISLAKETLFACQKQGEFFRVKQICHGSDSEDQQYESIIVDCFPPNVPTQNDYGIKPRERLALVFYKNTTHPPKVLSLRKNFPAVLHLNHTPSGTPVDLCLYIEPWRELRRSWTPQQHLQKIMWWLIETSQGTLHREDQPLERIFFTAPTEFILPPDFDERYDDSELVLKFSRIRTKDSEDNIKIVKGNFLKKTEVENDYFPNFFPLIINVPPIVHGKIEFFPTTLGELHERLKERKVSFAKELFKQIQNSVSESGVRNDDNNETLLILRLPIQRSIDEAPEDYQKTAFLIKENVALIGKSIGALDYNKEQDKYFRIGLVSFENKGWQNFQLFPVDIKLGVTVDFARRASGVDPIACDFNGTLGGVGALGGALADFWAKEAWGNWTLIDHDVLKSHNTVRHICKEGFIGLNKTEAVKHFVESNYAQDYFITESIPQKIDFPNNPSLNEKIINSDIFVDATTTLEVPRDISSIDDMPRSVSVFFTPSGKSSALLFEDENREIRLSSLEAQYYRAILNCDWGEYHLDANQGSLWVGAGCRDNSFVISYEDVMLHASILAKQTRLLRKQKNARIKIWDNDLSSGNILCHDIPVYPTRKRQLKKWHVVWDEGLEIKAKQLRHDLLPNETGGIICGYIDQVLNTIFIVDILPAPKDSKSNPHEFIRGKDNLPETLIEIQKRTANIVNYIGEWHSHPPFTSPNPSATDQKLLGYLANKMAIDGLPAIILIVGTDGDITIEVKEDY